MSKPALPAHRLPAAGSMARFQRGQSMIEYVVVCGVVALALGIGMADSNSVLWQLINAFQTAYARYSYAISLPT